MTERTTYEQVGDVALITMDDGKANVFGPPMIAAVNAQLDRAADEAKAVVLTGRPACSRAVSTSTCFAMPVRRRPAPWDSPERV